MPGPSKLTAAAAAEYVDRGYSRCPFCKSEEIEGGSLEVDGNHAWQEVICSACDAAWRDIYRLVGVYDEDADREFHPEKAD